MTALRTGDTISVRYSRKLEQGGNGSLVGKSGTVARVMIYNGMVIGAYVVFRHTRRVKSVYIPVDSIDGSAGLDRMQVMQILQTTIL